MGYKYDRKKEKDIDQRRDSFARRNFRIHFSPYRKGKLLPYPVFLSTQFYLYRTLRRLGTFCPSAYCAKTGRTVSDRRFCSSHSVVIISNGQILYILAAGHYPLPVVSFLFADAFCADAGFTYSNVPRKAR